MAIPRVRGKGLGLLATMKLLLLLTCLVAAALAMPEIVKQPKYLSLNEQRALLTEESNEIKEQAMASAQEDSSSSSSSEVKISFSLQDPVTGETSVNTCSTICNYIESEDAIPSTSEQKNIVNEDIINQCTLEQLQRQIKYNQLLQEALLAQRHPMSVVDQPLPQFFQYDSYPLWTYVPQDMHYLTPEAVLTTFQPFVPKVAEKTNEWW
uniref:alpha-S1-casein-like n=1 Tax=Arvicanthis niloticus TaxID=61156 RepID=UPI0014861383|nr:alpha-S1-casein-like [Arvicanthis niloticus]